MKTLLLTSDSLRHKYLANSMTEGSNPVLIISEKKSSRIQDISTFDQEDARLLSEHFKKRVESEDQFFGKFPHFPKEIPLIKIPHGKINSEAIIEIIRKSEPDMIILFGSSIIKKPLLELFPGKFLNLHLGLSPYYKGSATNLYPYFFGEPECIGATFHLATQDVDQGEILHQFRPMMEVEDTPHDIGNKVIQHAAELLPKILGEYQQGNIQPVIQEPGGKLCRNKDITPAVLRKIYANFKNGMIARYLAEKEERDKNRPLVDQLN